MMIGDKTPLEYAAQFIIYAQPFLWMWLHGSRVQLNEYLKYAFYLAGWAFIVFVWFSGLGMGFYTSPLLIQYAANTILAVYLLSQRRPFKEALCLGFLLVFLNSYYWELPLHIVEAAISLPLVRMVVQAWHLAPVPFLLAHYELSAAHRETVWMGFRFAMYSIAAIWVFTVFLGAPRIFMQLGYALVRTVCLLFLVKVYAEAEPKLGGKH